MSGSQVGEPVSATDSQELFERWRRDRNREARDELIARFLPLARKLARRYTQSSEPYDDLVQVASLGLVKAVERFDPDRGFAFTSFAVPTIVGELKRYFRDTGWAIHVDRGAQERARKINEARQAISARTGRPPRVDELAQYLELSEEEVLDGLQVAEAYGTVSLDAPLGGEEDASRLDAIGDEDTAARPDRRSDDDLRRRQASAPARARDPVPTLRRGPHPIGDRRTRRRLADAGLASVAPVAAATASANRREPAVDEDGRAARRRGHPPRHLAVTSDTTFGVRRRRARRPRSGTRSATGRSRRSGRSRECEARIHRVRRWPGSAVERSLQAIVSSSLSCTGVSVRGNR